MGKRYSYLALSTGFAGIVQAFGNGDFVEVMVFVKQLSFSYEGDLFFSGTIQHIRLHDAVPYGLSNLFPVAIEKVPCGRRYGSIGDDQSADQICACVRELLHKLPGRIGYVWRGKARTHFFSE